MMDEFMKRLADRFTAAELVELLDIDVEEITLVFADRIADAYDDLDELMTYGH